MKDRNAKLRNVLTTFCDGERKLKERHYRKKKKALLVQLCRGKKEMKKKNQVRLSSDHFNILMN